MEFSLVHAVITAVAFIVGFGIKYVFPDEKTDAVVEKIASDVIKEETGATLDLSKDKK
jgi:hypothetical protein